MNLVILVPDGVGIRNFVLGSFLQQAVKENQVHVLHTIPPELAPSFAGKTNGNVVWERLRGYRESPLGALLRYSLSYGQMYWADTPSMRFVRSLPVAGSWRAKTLRNTAKVLGKIAATPRGLSLVDRCHNIEVSRLPQVAYYRNLFSKLRPQVLFCSHQRPLEVIPPVLAARELGIPTATFIFSWDNLTSKGRIAAPFDHFLVWSDLMKSELLRFYPDVPAENIHIVGTPQFDPYVDGELLYPKEEFFAQLEADPARPLICYSGGDTGTAPEDHLHLAILMKLIRIGEIKGNPQVVLRPAPVDDGSRYAKVRRDFPELIYAQPAWMHTEPGNWARVIPSAEDTRLLANLTHHADLNVNLASTMTLDFALHDKPIVNIAFDVADQPLFGVPLWDFYYQFDHYRPVVELGAARFARSATELAEHINAYLADQSLDREARRQFVQLEVGIPLGTSSRKIVETLQHIGQNN